ncbi:MAG: hypothetical protein HUU54_07940 [Ignavibacteriaceae bacterium]|nr:hypothetical protein [Ignavibacteriaceae bacterium]
MNTGNFAYTTWNILQGDYKTIEAGYEQRYRIAKKAERRRIFTLMWAFALVSFSVMLLMLKIVARIRI